LSGPDETHIGDSISTGCADDDDLLGRIQQVAVQSYLEPFCRRPSALLFDEPDLDRIPFH
jgi:hypothetical protein